MVWFRSAKKSRKELRISAVVLLMGLHAWHISAAKIGMLRRRCGAPMGTGPVARLARKERGRDSDFAISGGPGGLSMQTRVESGRARPTSSSRVARPLLCPRQIRRLCAPRGDREKDVPPRVPGHGADPIRAGWGLDIAQRNQARLRVASRVLP